MIEKERKKIELRKKDVEEEGKIDFEVELDRRGSCEMLVARPKHHARYQETKYVRACANWFNHRKVVVVVSH